MSRRFLLPLVAVLLLAGPAAAPAATRAWTVHYTSADGSRRGATVLLPAGYGPGGAAPEVRCDRGRGHGHSCLLHVRAPGHDPAIPLVISPHGRGATGIANAKRWGDLPGRGGFAVVNPDGLGPYSYGAPGQIDDLARMPELVMRALPWLRVDRRRIYAVGSSMGGQETLLLVARYPRFLAGAVAMDAVLDLARRYREAPELRPVLTGAFGGTPDDASAAYAARSPLNLSDAIAQSGVPLQIWWSRADQIILSQSEVSRALVARLAGACVAGFEGTWEHSADMKAETLLPAAIARLGLLATRLPVARPALRASYPAPARCDRSASQSSTLPTR